MQGGYVTIKYSGGISPRQNIIPHAVVMSEHLCQVRMDALAFSGAALVVWQLVQKVVKAQLEFFERIFDLLWFPLACNLGSGQ